MATVSEKKKRRLSLSKRASSKSSLLKRKESGLLERSSSPDVLRRKGSGSVSRDGAAEDLQPHQWELLPDESAPLVTSEECAYRIIPPQYHELIPTNEEYIMSSRVKCPSELTKTFVLTRKSVYKLIREGDNLRVKGHWNLMDLYRVGAFAKNPAKKVHFNVRMIQIPDEVNKKVKVLGFGVGEASWECIRKKEYICETIHERVDWVWAITQLWIERWQYYFEVERALIPSPEIYQIHYFCSALHKKKLHYRYLLLSSVSMYMLEVRPLKGRAVEIVKTKWVLPIKHLESIIYYPRTDNRAFSVTVEATCPLVKSKVIKEAVTFIMNSEAERNDVRFEIKRIFARCAKKKLKEIAQEEP